MDGQSSESAPIIGRSGLFRLVEVARRLQARERDEESGQSWRKQTPSAPDGGISEAELHLLKQRMWAGRLNKVRRGEFVFALPSGYVRRHRCPAGSAPARSHSPRHASEALWPEWRTARVPRRRPAPCGRDTNAAASAYASSCRSVACRPRRRPLISGRQAGFQAISPASLTTTDRDRFGWGLITEDPNRGGVDDRPGPAGCRARPLGTGRPAQPA